MIETSIIIALAAGLAAVTITKSIAFQWLRNCAANYAPDWLCVLLGCPYCMAHWLVLIAVAIYRPRLVHSAVPVLDVFVSALAIKAVASAVAAILKRSFVWAIDEE